jgi:pyrimidine operon attenuation protein/uracil phosphoribosyltransferase
MRNQYDEDDLGKFVDHLVTGIATDFPPDRPLNIVGIRTRGETLAGRIAVALENRGFTAPGRGVLDITLYRDDLSEIGPRPMVRPTRIDIDLDAKPLLLVDDVLFTGRTVRAAMDVLADYGRPRAVELAVLVDRGRRELPIQPDFVGVRVQTTANQSVRVMLAERGEPDRVVLRERAPG